MNDHPSLMLMFQKREEGLKKNDVLVFVIEAIQSIRDGDNFFKRKIEKNFPFLGFFLRETSFIYFLLPLILLL